MLIAGDIGGTKTDLAIYSIESGPHAPLAQAQFHSADYHSLQAMVSEFLAQVKVPVAYASFDVAGPVIDGHVKTTNGIRRVISHLGRLAIPGAQLGGRPLRFRANGRAADPFARIPAAAVRSRGGRTGLLRNRRS